MKKEKTFYSILTILIFIPGSFLMWEVIRELCNMIGSLVCGDTARVAAQAKRMAPLYFAAFILIYLQAFVHKAFTAYNQRNRARIWKRNGIASIVLGTLLAAFVGIWLIIGEYARIIEGYIYPLFPLDILIFGVLVILFGIFAYRYGDDVRWRGSKLEYFTDGVNPFARIFRVLSYIVTMCSFVACAMAGFVIDWTHGGIFFNVMLCLVFFTPVAMALIYRFVFFNVSARKRNRFQIGTAVVFLIVNIVVLAVYMVSVQLQNEAPGQNAFAVLPVEFTASFNAFPLIYGANNIIAPLVALIRGLIKKK